MNRTKMFASLRKKFEKLTTPKSVYSIIHICAFLSRISLVFPFKFNNRRLELRPKLAFFTFTLQIILNIIMMSGFLCACSKVEFKGNPYIILGFSRTFLFNLFTLFATITMNRKSARIIKIFAMIDKIEAEVKLQSERLRRMFFSLIFECCFLKATWALFVINSLASQTKDIRVSKRIFFTFVSVFGVKLIPELYFIHFLNLIYLVGCFIDEIHDRMRPLSYSENFCNVPTMTVTNLT